MSSKNGSALITSGLISLQCPSQYSVRLWAPGVQLAHRACASEQRFLAPFSVFWVLWVDQFPLPVHGAISALEQLTMDCSCGNHESNKTST